MNPSPWTFNRMITTLALLAVLFGLSWVPNTPNALKAPAAADSGSSSAAAAAPLSYQSGGQLLSFQTGSWLLSDSTYALRVEFAGANPVTPQAMAAASGAANSPTALGTVTYTELWAGISLRYDAPPGSVARSTYTLAPGADPAAIRLVYNAPLALDEAGNLLSRFEQGQVSESKPVAWQEIAGQRTAVDVAFQLEGQQVGFVLGEYDRTQTLYIDPLIGWNTFLGQDGKEQYGSSLVVGSDGSIYYTGKSGYGSTWTCSPTPCTRIAHHNTSADAGADDAFIAKLDATGHLLWNTFLGSTSSLSERS